MVPVTKHPTQLSNLPIEMVLHILSYVDNKSVNSFSLTCKRNREIVKVIPLRVLFNRRYLASHKKYRSERRVGAIKFIDTVVPELLDVLENNFQYMEELDITDGYMDCKGFQRFLVVIQNLRKLRLKDFYMTCRVFDHPMKLDLNFEKLQVLELIDCSGGSDIFYRNFRTARNLKQLTISCNTTFGLELCLKMFRKLESLSLNNSYYTSFHDFNEPYPNQLKKLELGGIKLKQCYRILEGQTHLEELSLRSVNFERAPGMLELLNAAIEKSPLRQLTFDLMHEDFRDLVVKSNTSVTKIRMIAGRLLRDDFEVLRDKFPNLEDLEVDNTLALYNEDLNLLPGLKSLKTGMLLSRNGINLPNLEHFECSHLEMVEHNLDSFQINSDRLKHFVVRYMNHLGIQDFAKIFRRYPQLETFVCLSYTSDLDPDVFEVLRNHPGELKQLQFRFNSDISRLCMSDLQVAIAKYKKRNSSVKMEFFVGDKLARDCWKHHLLKGIRECCCYF